MSPKAGPLLTLQEVVPVGVKETEPQVTQAVPFQSRLPESQYCPSLMTTPTACNAKLSAAVPVIVPSAVFLGVVMAVIVPVGAV